MLLNHLDAPTQRSLLKNPKTAELLNTLMGEKAFDAF